MLSPIVASVGFFFRIAAFFCVLGILPRQVVPITAKVALALATLLFLLPMYPGEALTLTSLVSNGDGIFSLISSVPYQVLLAEIAIGLALGVLVSVSMYVAEVFAGYASMQMYAVGDEDEASRNREPGTSQPYHLLKAVLFLLVLYVIFHQRGFASILEYIGSSFLLQPLIEPGTIGPTIGPTTFASGIGLILGIGSQSFLISALIAVPFFLVSLLMDFLFLLQRRYFAPSFSASVVPGARAAVLLLLLSMNIYVYVTQMKPLIVESTELSPEKLPRARTN